MLGTSLLHYEIKERLGKGGMGEVFRARDTKLGRDVAVKILPTELSGDPEREARFQREARALASLQHPNVASVYGFEEADGIRFLVMELVCGDELTRRMKQGPVPVQEVLGIARQLAAGLEAAHESGIVHRDLKPANVMETAEGEIKILDFGLAQAWFGDASADSGSSLAPTITAAMTQAGAILGTAAYMSPEQARGHSVDRRADIWAFGVILFELLTGKQLFQGETISDTLAAVLRAEPEWQALPVDAAPGLCRLIERCLERNPKQRLRDIGEARIFLQDDDASGSHLSFSAAFSEPVAAGPGRAGVPRAVLALVAVACLAVGAMVGWQVLARPEP
ncbi:MAG: serine/threonine-protein kinase, partial [Candidatus Krumholzibacteriia bacterium]